MLESNTRYKNKQSIESLAFLKGLLHDLASPLTMVQMNLDIAFSELHSHDAAKLIKNLERAMLGVEHVNSVILSAKSELYTEAVEKEFSAIAEIAKVLEINGPLIEENRIEVEEIYEADKVFYACPSAFGRVFANIITNSIEALAGSRKFNKLISLHTYFQKDQFIVEIKDNGPGFSSPDKAMIPGFTSKIGNLGLGLAISEYILCSSFQADMQILSKGRGACVVVKFPLTKSNRAVF